MDVELLIKQGDAALHLGQFDRALQCFSQAVAASPFDPMALRCHGVALSALGRYEEALEYFRRAVAAWPNHPNPLCNVGTTLYKLERHEEALLELDRALALDPDHVHALNSRGLVLRGLERNAEALACFDRVLAINPNFAEALNNRAIILRALGRYEDDLASLGRALALNPADFAAYYNLSGALLKVGRPEEARQALDRACALRPQDTNACFARAQAQLLLGDLPAGFRGFELRWEILGKEAKADTDRPLWLGETAIEGKTILLHGEQGLGDILQFVRYAPMVAALGARVVLRTRPPLMRLFAGMPGVAQLVSETEPLPAHDLHCPLMTLPVAFGTTVETIPAEIPYLKAEPSRVAEWKEKLGPASRPRLGLVWAGNPDLKQASIRDIPFKTLLPLLQLPADFISLQKVIDAADRPAYDRAPNLVRIGETLSDFADTAALVENLDLVIAVDTSTLHLSAALGRPVWLMNRLDTCWRWLTRRNDSPWYPTLRQFRQRTAGDWDGVVQDIARELTAAGIVRP